jgi:ABC-type thiamine transport system ATPase subunit
MPLEDLLRQAERELSDDIANLRLLATQGQDATKRLNEAKAGQEDLNRAVTAMNQISEESHHALLRHIETTVTAGLESIFGPGMSLKLTPSTHGKLTTTEITIVSNGMETGILSARGGGVAAIVGLLIRMVLVVLDDRVDKTLVLDETLAQVSREYEEPLAEFVQNLARETGLQLIIITHSDAFDGVADVTHRLELTNGHAALV